MKKQKLDLDDDFIFSKRFEHPLDEVLKILLKNVQSDPRCRNKVPILEIGDHGNDIYYLIPRKQLRSIITKSGNLERTLTEKKLLKMTGHR